MRTVFPGPAPRHHGELTRTGRLEGELVIPDATGHRSWWPVAGLGVARPAGPRRFSRRTTTSPTQAHRGRLQQAQTELARVTRVTALGELAASIAHEITSPWPPSSPTPAPASTGWTPTRRRSTRSGAGRHRERRRPRGGGLTRIEPVARSAVARQPCRLAQIITDVLPLVRSEFPPSRSCSRFIGCGPATGLAIASSSSRWLINLLVNAAEAMRDVPARGGGSSSAACSRHRRARPGCHHRRGRGRRPRRAPGRSPFEPFYRRSPRPGYGPVHQPLHLGVRGGPEAARDSR